jgi:predicted transcriptional regulator
MALIRPTEAELAILQVLWTRGASTVRAVYEAIASERETGYTTTLKLMQIMAEKGLVTRDESEKTHVYAARLTRARTQKQLVRDLADRAFGGSAAALVLQALSDTPPSQGEIEEIQRLIEEHRKAKPPAGGRRR